MRLDVSIFGILACSAGLVIAEDNDTRSDGGASSEIGTASTGTTSNVVISVQALPTYPVYTQQSGNQIITYSKGADIDITDIYLKRYNGDTCIGTGDRGSSGSSNTNTGANAGTNTGLHFNEMTLDQRADASMLPPFKFPISNDSVTLLIGSNFETLYNSNLGQPLYYEFQWKNSTSSGSSFSQLIAVALDSGYDAAVQAIVDTNKETGPALPETIQPLNGPTITSNTATPAAETSAASLTAAASNNGGNGLSRGAVVGIAVGCSIAGVLIIAFIVWFFIFRKRTNRDRTRGADFANDSRTHAIMADKEATVISESSPHSAYPDDGGRLRDPRGDNDSYAPYSDRGVSPPPPPGAAFTTNSQTDLASLGHTSTTRAATPPYQSRYAHLIEEGMTEEEIRRLEEEERHLDAAIEDAGRNSRAARPS
ncbi:hypothetical protein F4776DRAFT_662124 [Hypoxylon sp. NC0597]|nr:hypothetical protein F4776DRAFT_662124 [Hypoxylon sp. NC0597]